MLVYQRVYFLLGVPESLVTTCESIHVQGSMPCEMKLTIAFVLTITRVSSQQLDMLRGPTTAQRLDSELDN